MTDKTLFIHAGGSKSGSSALQHFFYHNAPRLEKYDFNFDIRRGTNNGMLLYKVLTSVNTTENAVDSAVSKYFGQSNNAICSSEYFQLTDARGWKKLLESTSRLGIKLKVIFYVRNVIPFLLSNYDQVIKCRGESRLFDEWALDAPWDHIKALRIIADELPSASIKVLHFDQAKANLFRGFLDILGVDHSFEISTKERNRLVNRSLTDEERGVLLAVNKALGSAYSSEVSKLIYINPSVRGQSVSYGRAQTELLSIRFVEDVDWVNQTFFNNQPVVSVLPMEPTHKTHNKTLRNIRLQHNEIDRRVLNWALAKLNTIKEETEQRLLKALENAAQNVLDRSHPDIPADFDSLAYLLLNPDVLLAGFDPIQHFLIHGKQEGRVYRFL